MIDSKGLADSIMARDKKPDREDTDPLEVAAGELLDAVDKKDKPGIASALRAAVSMCMDEYGEPNE